MKLTWRHIARALLATALWVGIGLYKRTQDGQPLVEATWAELPLGAVVFAVSLVWVSRRRR
ncbi:hypothetical protein GCM10008955_24310 [Deinococcus malanensis]|uniref:Uncharacterized protein n=1 Tax=Deinococcus malanensis TaxID=1706855 RepID=A0ABQ2EZN6_9DEIO|nr:hypothetical protein [Deinococcus malanensis]GGK29659.1 hypothetical protein GCM10008955_24310 [Deinococcus malanensis]